MFTDFMLEDQWSAAMDSSARMHDFKFNEAVPEAEQCSWLKDTYGVSWQIVPSAMNEMMNKGSPEQMARVTQAFMPMKKFDTAKLKQAYED